MGFSSRSSGVLVFVLLMFCSPEGFGGAGGIIAVY